MEFDAAGLMWIAVGLVWIPGATVRCVSVLVPRSAHGFHFWSEKNFGSSDENRSGCFHVAELAQRIVSSFHVSQWMVDDGEIDLAGMAA